MPRSSTRWLAALGALAALSSAGQALAWGNSGHRIIGTLGAQALPNALPAFLRTPAAAAEIGELSREPDRSRGGGQPHDNMRDPAHFVDIDDDGRIVAGPRYDALPVTFTDYETALRAAGTDSAKAGFLPYALLDGWQQLAKDFALWRTADYGVKTETNRARRQWLIADRADRQRLIIRDLGVWSHYVGDTSYPLHVSSHYNGWGEGPNPKGYTLSRIHVPLEGPFVGHNVKMGAVKAAMAPYAACGCTVQLRITRYIASGFQLVEPLYALHKAGGFRDADPRGVAFMTGRLAAAASQLRDLTVDAWTASETVSVGYPAITLADIKGGKSTAYDVLYSTGD
jgi:hypothetical protein